MEGSQASNTRCDCASDGSASELRSGPFTPAVVCSTPSAKASFQYAAGCPQFGRMAALAVAG
jgi:hypothetical protein